MATWSVQCGDCLDLLRALPDGSVDAVVTDPPYGIGQAKWDGFVPVDWLWQARRVVRNTGAIYIFGNPLTLSRVQVYAESMGWKWAARTTWVYEDGPRSSKRWTAKHEDCLVWHGDKHVQATPTEPSIHKDPRWGDDRFVGSVWRCARVKGNAHERVDHPTQKPVALMMLPVVASCPEGGIVLDPFCGSGTTGVACAMTGRNFIGMERDPGYCEIARRRMSGAVPLGAAV